MSAIADVLVSLVVGVIANLLTLFLLRNFDKPSSMRVTNGSVDLRNSRVSVPPIVEASADGVIVRGSTIELIRHERPELRYGLSVGVALVVFVILLVVLVKS